MCKKIITGLLLMTMILLCACNTNTYPEEEPPSGIPVDATANTYTAEEEEIFALIKGDWLCENQITTMRFYEADATTENLTFPGYLYRADLGVLSNDPIFDLTYGFENDSEVATSDETAITITSIDDKDTFIGYLLVANDGSYIKYPLMTAEDYHLMDGPVTWYYFYPSDGDTTALSDYAIEQMELFELVHGQWICETDAAYINIYLPENAGFDWDYDITIDCNPTIHSYGYWVNDFATFEAGVPHYAYPPEEGILENETAVYFNSRNGEFSTGGLLIVDNERRYMKFELENGTWYNFYPYERETDLYEYIYSKSLATYVMAEAGIDTFEEDSLLDTVIVLNGNFLIDHFYEVETTPFGDGNYYYETNAKYLDIWGDNWTITFYTDAKGNLIKQDDIKEEQIR